MVATQRLETPGASKIPKGQGPSAVPTPVSAPQTTRQALRGKPLDAQQAALSPPPQPPSEPGPGRGRRGAADGPAETPEWYDRSTPAPERVGAATQAPAQASDGAAPRRASPRRVRAAQTSSETPASPEGTESRSDGQHLVGRWVGKTPGELAVYCKWLGRQPGTAMVWSPSTRQDSMALLSELYPIAQPTGADPGSLVGREVEATSESFRGRVQNLVVRGGRIAASFGDRALPLDAIRPVPEVTRDAMAAPGKRPESGPRERRTLDMSGDLVGQLIEWLNPFSRPGSSLSMGVSLGLSAELAKVLEFGGEVAFDLEFSTDDLGLYSAQMTLSGAFFGKLSAWMLEFQALRSIRKTWACVGHGLAEIAGVVMAPLVAIMRAIRQKAGQTGVPAEQKDEPKAQQPAVKPGLDTATFTSADTYAARAGGAVGKGEGAPGASLAYAYTGGKSTTEHAREAKSGGKTTTEHTSSRRDFSRHELTFVTGPTFEGKLSLAFETIAGHALVANDGDYRTFGVQLVARAPITNQNLFTDYMTTLIVAYDFVHGLAEQLKGAGKALMRSPGKLKELATSLAKAMKEKKGGNLRERVVAMMPTAPWKQMRMNPVEYLWSMHQADKQTTQGKGLALTVHQVHSQGAWSTQYTRFLTLGGYEVSSKVPLYGAINGTFASRIAQQSNRLEFAGGGTTTYHQTRHNGIALRTGFFDWQGGKDPEKKPVADQQWMQYAASQSGALQSVYLSLGEGAGVPHKEVAAMDSAEPGFKPAKERLLTVSRAIRDAAKQPGIATLKPADGVPATEQQTRLLPEAHGAMGDLFSALPAVKGRAPENRGEDAGFQERAGPLGNQEGYALHARVEKGQPIAPYDLARLIRWYGSGLIVTQHWEIWIGNAINIASNAGTLSQVLAHVPLADCVRYVKDSRPALDTIIFRSWIGLLQNLAQSDTEGFVAHIAPLIHGNAPQQHVFRELMRKAQATAGFEKVVSTLARGLDKDEKAGRKRLAAIVGFPLEGGRRTVHRDLPR